MSGLISSILGTGLTAFGAITSFPILFATATVGYVAMALSSLLLSLGGLITGVANNLQSLILSDQNIIVTVGWTIVRDIANLGFVLVIIVIALATILRMEGYGAKKLLPRLIAAAILVNFSLQIGASIIGFAQVITDFFFTKISLNPFEIGNTILGAFGPQRFIAGLGQANDVASFLTSLNSTAINLVVGPWFATAFNLIMLFTILILAFMLLIRFFQLSFLLIISPITWLFFVIPGLKNQFSRWWSKFFQWVFFAPAVSFFVYLSFAAAQRLSGFARGGEGTLVGIEGIIQNIFMSGVEVILLSGFLISGLIAAQSLSVTGAKGAMGLLGKAGKGAQAWAGRRARQAGAAGLASKPVTGLAGWLQKERRLGGLWRTPGILRKAGMRLEGQSEVVRRQLVEESDRQLAKYNDTRLGMSLDTLSAPQRIAAMERLAKSDNMNLIKKKDTDRSSPTYGQYVESATGEIMKENRGLFTKYGRQQQWKSVEVAAGMDVDSANALRKGPAAVDEFNKAMEKWIAALKPEHIAKLPVNNIFTGEPIVSKLGLKDEDSSKMYRRGLVEGIASRVPGDLVKLFSKVKGVGFDGLHEAATELQAKFEGIATDPNVPKTAQDAALKRYESITKALEGSVAARFYSGMYGGGGAVPPPPPKP